MPYTLFFAAWIGIISLLHSQPAWAQRSGHIYYTAAGHAATSPDSAAYYTVVRKQGVGGSITTYQLNGQRLHQEQYSQLRSGQRHGFSTEWNAATGRRTARYLYQHGKLHGVAQAWYPGGQRRWELQYQQGQRHGALRAWYPNGRIMRTEIYRAGVRIAARCFTLNGRDTAWFAFERPAQFAGGNQALHRWLTSHLRYPAIALRNQIEGTIWVRFSIDKHGQVQQPEVIKGLMLATDEEVQRLLKTMPLWQPAVVAGRAVAVSYELPVEFRIL